MKIIPTSRRNRYIAGIGIVLVVVILVVAINTSSNRLDNELDVSPLEAAVLELDSGASIEIPFGAIFEETTLSITEVEPPESGGSVPSPVYDFSAGDAELFEPVKLKIPYDAPNSVTPDELSAIRWLEDSETWEVLGGDVDTVSKAVEVEVEHLSLFSVFWDIEDDSSETSSPQVEPVIGLFEPRYLRTDYVLMGQEFEMYYSFTNRGEDTFFGTLVLELTFPENPAMQMQRFSYDDFKVTRSGFLEVIYSCHDSDLDSIVVKGQEYGNLVMQLDVIFRDDNGEELGRDSKQYSILIVDKSPLDSVVEVDGSLYRVSSNYDSEGKLSYEVRDFDTEDKVEDISIRDKAVYTTWKQENIRLFNAGFYELESWVSAVPKIGAHLGGSTAWLFGKTGSLSIAVITGGFWGLGVEIGKDVLIGVIKQIGDHPEAYTEQVAIDLIDEWYARTNKWTDTKVSVANGEELSFHDALEMHNDLNFNIIYGPPARNSLNAIWNEDLSSWSSDTLKAGTVELAEDVTELSVGEIKYLANVVSVLLELNGNSMDYPPYALLVNQSAENKEHYYEEYYDNLAMLGIEETSPFSLQVFEASLPQEKEEPPDEFSLTISSTAGGSVTTPGEGGFVYDAGTVVNLVATPASGYGFVNWDGDTGSIDDVENAETTITMNGDYYIIANFEEVQEGVKAGDWIEVEYTVSDWPAGESYPEGLKLEFLSVDGSTVTVRLTGYMSDGTEESVIVSMSLVEGSGEASDISGLIIAPNLTTGDSVYITGYGDVTIEGETTRTYVGANRIVVYASCSQYESQGTYYWDKLTGVMVESSETLVGITIVGKVTDTNMWGDHN